MRRLAVLLVALASIGSGANAQTIVPAAPAGFFGVDAGPDVPADFFGDSELDASPKVDLKELSAAAARAHVRDVTPVRFGPFAAGTAFASARVFLGRSTPPDYERGLADGASIELVVAATDRRGRERWWRLEERPGEYVDIFDISDERRADERVTAAVDRATPLLKVEYGHEAMGANTGSEHHLQLLLDLRTPQPRVLAAFEHVSVEGGGVCTAHDIGHGWQRRTGCRWDPARRDYVCTERRADETAAWRPSFVRRFLLQSGSPIPSPTAGLPSLVALADRLERVPQSATGAEVQGLGWVERVAAGSLRSGARYQLFALMDPAGEAAVRVRAVVTPPNGAATVREVPRVVTLSPGMPQLGEVIDAVRAKRVGIVAHQGAGPSALEWTIAHPEQAAGLVLLEPLPQGQQPPKVRGLLGSPADRVAYVRGVAPRAKDPEAIAALMTDRSSYLDPAWMRMLAHLAEYPLSTNLQRLKGTKVFVAGAPASMYLPAAAVVAPYEPFAPMTDPDAFNRLLDSILKELQP